MSETKRCNDHAFAPKELKICVDYSATCFCCFKGSAKIACSLPITNRSTAVYLPHTVLCQHGRVRVRVCGRRHDARRPQVSPRGHLFADDRGCHALSRAAGAHWRSRAGACVGCGGGGRCQTIHIMNANSAKLFSIVIEVRLKKHRYLWSEYARLRNVGSHPPIFTA
jgi:hypothetical protein